MKDAEKKLVLGRTFGLLISYAVVAITACTVESDPRENAAGSAPTEVTASVPNVAPASVDPFITLDANGLTTVHPRDARFEMRSMPRAVPGELLVKFKPGASRIDIAKSLGRVPMRSTREYQSIKRLQLVRLSAGASTAEAINALTSQGSVEYVEANYLVRKSAIPNDSYFAEQYGLHNTGQGSGFADADIDAPEGWDVATGGSNVVVAVIDSGADYNHEDLGDNIYASATECSQNGVDDDANGYIDDCHGIDTANRDSDPMDDEGHGTHVAGIIGAVGNNAKGIAGVAWNVKILPCKFMDATGSGSIADAIACLDYIAALKDRGVNIVASNNSWADLFESHALRDAIATQLDRGILFVTASGNSSELDGELWPSYPCSYYLPNVVCVGAFDDIGSNAYFSVYGKTQVHLIAPGVSILSTLPGNEYGFATGTSAAAPHVVGAIALLKAQDAARDWRVLKNLLLAGSEPRAPTRLIGGHLNVHNSLACTNSTLSRRLRPVYIAYDSTQLHRGIGDRIELAALNINCGNPGGAVAVTVAPGNQVITLLDDGTDGDLAAGDGIYSSTWIPTAAGEFTLTFPGGDVVPIVIDPILKPGFPVKTLHLPGQYLTGQSINVTVGNIDLDPKLEILTTGLAQGPLYAWKADGTLLPGWPVLEGWTGAAYTVLGKFLPNVTGSQVFVSYFSESSSLYSGAGITQPGWPQPFPAFPSGTPMAADLDGDGLDEILHGARLRADGSIISLLPVDGMLSALGDLDGDGETDLVRIFDFRGGVSQGYEVHAYRLDGSSLPGFPIFRGPGSTLSYPLIGDVDGDGANEIVVLTIEEYPWETTVRTFGSDGREEWTIVQDVGASPAQPALADMNGDGIPELLVQSSSQLNIWQDGISLPGWPQSTDFFRVDGTAPIVGDLTGDQSPEVVASCGARLCVWSANGSLLPGFPKTVPTGSGGVPAIADIDLDGRNDLIIVSQAHPGVGVFDKVWVYDLGGPPTAGPIEWGQLKGGSGHLGYYETGKNLVGQAYLAAKVIGDGAITSSPTGISCGQSCLQKFATGTTVTLTATATGAGTFERWLGACAGQGNPCVLPIQNFSSAIAKFSTHDLSVSVDGGGTVTSDLFGISCPRDCSHTYSANVTVTLTAAPLINRYFVGWSGACSGVATTCTVTMNAAKSVVAIFADQPRLTFSKSGSGTIAVTSPGGIDCEHGCITPFLPGTVVTLTATPAPNFSVEWVGACSGRSTTCSVTMDADKSVHVRFSNMPSLTVVKSNAAAGTVTATPSGIECGSNCVAEYPAGTTVTLTATPAAGFVFSGWSGACAGTSATCSVTLTAPASATATFIPKPQLSVTKTGSGIGSITAGVGINCGTDCSESYLPGEVVTLTAVAAADSVFDSWSGACSGSTQNCSVTMDVSKSVSARFLAKQLLSVMRSGPGTGTVNSDVAGISCGNDCSELFAPGSLVTLTAAPAAGSTFEGWTGACTGQSFSCTVSMDSARTVIVTFGTVPPPASSGGGGGGGAIGWALLYGLGSLLFFRSASPCSTPISMHRPLLRIAFLLSRACHRARHALAAVRAE